MLLFKKIFLTSVILLITLFFPKNLFADDPLENIRLKTDFNIWKVNLNRSGWFTDYPKLSWNSFEVKLPPYLEDRYQEEVDRYLENKMVKGVDYSAVQSYLEKWVAPDLHREKQDVTISMADDGNVVFEGFAFSGQEVDFEKTFYLVKEAYLKNEQDIRVPLKTIPPTVAVQSQELIDKGIVELIATGETDYSGSPSNRRNNIRVGLSRFDGWLIPPTETASVIQKLGPVTGQTGYLPELVIKGNKTIPEYGGGLCQVSTTLFRSILFAGLPIVERKNHSYAVSYYDPQGLDATIYIPNPDLKFTNDTDHYILIQTTTIGDKAYSNVYGMSPDRHVDLIGPWYYSYRRAPAAKVEYSDQLPPGKKEILSGSHDGFEASWYRRISYAEEGKEDFIEHIYSRYEARGLFSVIGSQKPTAPAAPSENGT